MRIHVKVKPNSQKQEIKKISNKEYEISLKKPPEDNKANIELLKLLKKTFKKNIKLISGHTSRKKIVEIKDGN
jgi:uncharacterized protein (TIGR00251 family)